MAHGAPDHIRLSDDAHAHFRWFRVWVDPVAIVSGVVTQMFYLTGVKTMGSLFIQTDWKELSVRIHIDGVNIDITTPKDIWDDRLFSAAGNAPGWSISQYDEVNNKYCLFWNPLFKCYVHKSIQINVYHTAGVNKQMNMAQLVYLQKV